MRGMKSFYSALSLMVTNLIMLFIGFNIAVFFFLQMVHALPRWLSHVLKPSVKHPLVDAKLYSGWTQPEVAQLMRETYETAKISSYDYDQITQLKLRQLHGRYVNIEDGGFRRVGGQGPWPLDPSALNIFVFGGSTAFGFALDDDHTIPSYLQEFARSRLRRHVDLYNFGRPGYTSTQELLLFLSLLHDGFIPNVAVFVDGLNDCQEWTRAPILGLPWPDAYVYSAIEAEKNGIGYMLLQRLPMSSLATFISAGLGLRHGDEAGRRPSEVQAFIVNRWLKNKKAIETLGGAYAVKVAFIWQPVAAYKYDLSYNAFGDDKQLESEKYIPLVYPAIDMMGNRGLLGKNFLSLAGIQQDNKEILYVDPWHYNETFSAEIASKINHFLQARRMLD